MFGRVAALVLSHRVVFAVAVVLSTSVLALGALRLHFDFRFTGFMGSRDPAHAQLASFIEAWGRADDRLLLLAEVADGTLLEPRRLRAVDATLRDVAAVGDVGPITSLTSTPRNVSTQPGVIEVRPLRESVPDDDALAGRWQHDVLADPDLVPGLLARTGRATVAIATLSIDTDDILDVRPAVQRVRAALAPHQGMEGVHWVAAGIPAVRSDLVDLLLHDTLRFAALSLVVAVMLLLLMFRSVHGVIVPLGSTVIPVSMLYGIMGWLAEPIGLLSQIYVTLIPAIAVADGIHIVARFHEEARARTGGGGRLSPKVRRDAIVATLEKVGTACFFTSLTTAVGFASLVVADMQVLRSFGLFAAIGILLAFLTMVIVVPLLLSLIPAVAMAPTTGLRSDRWLAAVAGFTLRTPRRILLACAIFVTCAGLLASQVQVDNWLRDNLAPNHETQHANDTLDRELGGTVPLNLDLRAEAGALFEPTVLRAVARVERWARAQPEVRAVLGPAALLERLSETLLGTRSIPDERALVEQVLLLAADQTTADLVLKPSGERGRILVQLPDLGGRAFEAFAVRLGEESSRAFAGLDVQPVVTGMSYVAYRGLNRLSGELVASLVAAFLVITVMLAVLFHDLRLALLCLIPNAVPLVTCLAAMALLGWDMNPTSAVVFTVALGIAVDDTIHLVARSLEAERSGHGGIAAITHAMVRTGRALLITSVILGVGFGLNALSSFRVNRWFGALGALAITSAFVLDLLVLPVLLRLFGTPGLRAPETPQDRVPDPASEG